MISALVLQPQCINLTSNSSRFRKCPNPKFHLSSSAKYRLSEKFYKTSHSIERLKFSATKFSSQTQAKSSDAETEEGGYKKRAEEAKEAGIVEKRPPQGGDPPPPGEWKWTLNWDPVTYTEDGQVEIIVGSCPKTPDDVLRLKTEAGVEAMLSLQSDVCLEAMGVEWEDNFKTALKENIMYTRVPVYDFDRIDQAAMLPEMVRRLATNIALGRRTYVHCTAGINRATLTCLGYMTFVRGMSLDDALAQLQEARPQAHPYIDCWKLCRDRLLAGKDHDVYLETQVKGCSKEEGGDWIKRDWDRASTVVIQKQFERAIASDFQNMTCVALLQSNGKKINKKDKKDKKAKKEKKQKKEKSKLASQIDDLAQDLSKAAARE